MITGDEKRGQATCYYPGFHQIIHNKCNYFKDFLLFFYRSLYQRAKEEPGEKR